MSVGSNSNIQHLFRILSENDKRKYLTCCTQQTIIPKRSDMATIHTKKRWPHINNDLDLFPNQKHLESGIFSVQFVLPTQCGYQSKSKSSQERNRKRKHKVSSSQTDIREICMVLKEKQRCPKRNGYMNRPTLPS
jgi:hypothetical protein